MVSHSYKHTGPHAERAGRRAELELTLFDAQESELVLFDTQDSGLSWNCSCSARSTARRTSWSCLTRRTPC